MKRIKRWKKFLFLEIPKTEILNVWLSLLPMLVGIFIYGFVTSLNPGQIDLSDPELLARIISMLIIIPIPLVVNLLLMGAPKIDPLADNYEGFSNTYSSFRRFIVIFFDLLIVGSLVMMLGVEISFPLYATFTIGCLFVVIGGGLRDTKQNYYFGIRTPWAMLSQDNWTYTHNIASKLFITGGTLLAILGLLPIPLLALITMAVLIVIILSIVPAYY